VSAFSADTNAKDERDFPLRTGSVGVVLVHRKTGVVLDTLTLEGSSASTSVGSGPAPEETACTATVSATKDRLVVTRSCRTEARDCESWTGRACDGPNARSSPSPRALRHRAA
jgi:hypothetical protein